MTIIVLAVLALAVAIDVLRAARRKAAPPPLDEKRINVDLRRRW